MAKAVSIMADSDDCSITLTGEAAARVWNYILEEVYIQKSIDIDIELKKSPFETTINEGYLGKV